MALLQNSLHLWFNDVVFYSRVLNLRQKKKSRTALQDILMWIQIDVVYQQCLSITSESSFNKCGMFELMLHRRGLKIDTGLHVFVYNHLDNKP